jgi:hypothetical protein
MKHEPKIPRPTIVDGNYFVVASEFNSYLEELAGRPARQPSAAPMELIPLREAARRSGRCVRTLKRKIKETYGAPDGVNTYGALAKRALEAVR